MSIYSVSLLHCGGYYTSNVTSVITGQKSELYRVILSERFIATSPAGYCKIFTAPPVSLNGIEPNTTGYTSDGSSHIKCEPRQEVLIDGDIGPTQSVDLSDPVQVQTFFAWHIKTTTQWHLSSLVISEMSPMSKSTS